MVKLLVFFLLLEGNLLTVGRAGTVPVESFIGAYIDCIIPFSKDPYNFFSNIDSYSTTYLNTHITFRSNFKSK